MTKAEVIKIMGEPASTSADGGVESLHYTLADSGDHRGKYYVRLVNGKVESYGEEADFRTRDLRPMRNVRPMREPRLRIIR
jgi:hypothetical protein